MPALVSQRVWKDITGGGQKYDEYEISNFEWSCPICVHFEHTQIEDRQRQTGDRNLVEVGHKGGPARAYNDLHSILGNRGIKVAHINVNGLISKLTQIEILLKDCNIDVLAMTETHLTNKIADEELSIQGYDFQRSDRKHKLGGGCLVYYKENLTVIPKSDIVKDEKIESVWVELLIKSQRFLIGTICRPQKDTRFFEVLPDILSDLWMKRKHIILLGDFNCDLTLKGNSQDEAYLGRRMKRIMNSFDLKNIVKDSTRIATTSKTIIDLIIVSNGLSEKIVKSGAFEPAISDHKLVYCVLKLKSENSKPIYKDVKMKGQFDQQLFQNTLEQAPWWVSNLFDDVDDITQFWETMYKEIVHDFVNTRKSKVRRRSLPWVNRDIKKLTNQRYKSLQKCQENRENSELRHKGVSIYEIAK